MSPLIFQLTTSQGGRLLCVDILPFSLYFNSRPRKEVDVLNDYNMRVELTFQLTTSQGGRLVFKCSQLTNRNFNSRPRKEVDYQKGTATTTFGISTHDLARRSTSSLEDNRIVPIFQLTTSQGGRHIQHLPLIFVFHFNSRPRKEVDHSWIHARSIEAIFQLTTSQGGRQLI